MLKIFALIGSPRRNIKSNTIALTKMMLEELQSMGLEFEYELLSAGDLKINFCTGCGSCVKTGKCPQDKKDDLEMIKQKTKEADVIIWGSPVYTYSVAGQMKVIMDRFCSWYHVMPLLGKLAISVSTAGHDGFEQVHNLNEALLSVMGAPVINKFEALGHDGGLIPEAEENAVKAAKEIYPYLSGEKKFKTSEMMEFIFTMMRSKVKDLKEHMPEAYQHWVDSGMKDAESFEEVYKKNSLF